MYIIDILSDWRRERERLREGQGVKERKRHAIDLVLAE